MRERGVQRASDYSRRHLLTGWWSLLLFATMGLALESLHGFKARTYLDVSNETRRLMWTLAHAHGTLLALVNVVFGLTLRSGLDMKAPELRLVSLCFLAASALLPAGFLLGGLAVHGGDPGLGVLLVPIGAALLLWALFCVSRATTAS